MTDLHYILILANGATAEITFTEDPGPRVISDFTNSGHRLFQTDSPTIETVENIARGLAHEHSLSTRVRIQDDAFHLVLM